MPTVADFPDGVATTGPTINRLIDQVVDYKTDVFKYDDGGADLNVQPCGVRRWTLEYDGLSQGELTALRTHYDLAKNKVNDFSFYHRRDAATYTGVQYDSLRIGRHVKSWSVPVTVVLVRFI